MNNLQLDCALSYLNEGKIINPIELLSEQISYEINQFNSLMESDNIINESISGYIANGFKKIVEFIKNIVTKIAEKIKYLFDKNKVAAKATELKAHKYLNDKNVDEKISNNIADFKDYMTNQINNHFGDKSANESTLLQEESINIPSLKDGEVFIIGIDSVKINFIGNMIDQLEAGPFGDSADKYREIVNEINSIDVTNIFKFKKIRCTRDFISPARIKSQYKEINDNISLVENNNKKLDKLGRTIEKRINSGLFDDDSKEVLKEMQRAIPAISTFCINELEQLNWANQFATKNYNHIFAAL